jgi:hypothetical protein
MNFIATPQCCTGKSPSHPGPRRIEAAYRKYAPASLSSASFKQADIDEPRIDKRPNIVRRGDGKVNPAAAD